MDHKLRAIMNRERRLFVSIALNVALVVLVIWAANRRLSDAEEGEVQSRAASRAIRVGIVTNEPTPLLHEVSAPFHWSELESSDYRVYIANLRAIGCPEATIRDIIEAELNTLFTERVKLLVEEPTREFWNLMVEPERFEKVVKDKQRELNALDRERDRLMALLLDDDATHAQALARAKRAEKFADWKWRYDFLSEEKIAALLDTDERFETARAELENNDSDLSDDERRERHRAIRDQREREIATLLTQDERAEYQLRNSRAADLRNASIDIEISEAESRALALARAGPQSEEQMARILGSERHAVAERETNGDYQQTARIVERFDLPKETAVRIFQMQKQVQTLARQVRDDTSRSAEERLAILQAMQTETEASIAQTLGAAPFKAYKKYGAGWLSKLTEDVR